MEIPADDFSHKKPKPSPDARPAVAESAVGAGSTENKLNYET